MIINFEMKDHTYSATYNGSLEDFDRFISQTDLKDIVGWNLEGCLPEWEDEKNCLYSELNEIIRDALCAGVEVVSVKKVDIDDAEFNQTYLQASHGADPIETDVFHVIRLSNGRTIITDGWDFELVGNDCRQVCSATYENVKYEISPSKFDRLSKAKKALILLPHLVGFEN